MSDVCDDADILIEQRREHALAQIPRCLFVCGPCRGAKP